MKYKKIILAIISVSMIALVILFSFVLRGNFFKYNDINVLIHEPKSKNILIKGTWKINSIESLDGLKSEINDEEKLYISNDIISFKKMGTKNPKFKFRYINFKNYLSSKGIINSKISINSDEAVIVSVTNGTDYYQEFIVIDDTHIATIFNKQYILFELEKKDVDTNSISIENSAKDRDISFLIGLKTLGNKDVVYQTYLIRKNLENKIEYKKIDGLLVNKDNNFFLVNSTNDNKEIFYTQDYIGKKNKKSFFANNSVINFLSENYISFEKNNSDNVNKSYEIHKVNQIDENKKLSVKDISGDLGENSYFESVLKIGYRDYDKTLLDMSNIGVKRNNNKWVFKSIFNNYKSDSFTTTEFDLDLIPTVDIFENSSTKFSKSFIKSKADNFTDYFVSPNEKLLIILTLDELMVYSIDNGVSSTLPILKINLSEKKEVVTFQWKFDTSSEYTYNEFKKIN